MGIHRSPSLLPAPLLCPRSPSTSSSSLCRPLRSSPAAVNRSCPYKLSSAVGWKSINTELESYSRNRRAACFDGRPGLTLGQDEDITAARLLITLRTPSLVLSFAPLTFIHFNAVAESVLFRLTPLTQSVRTFTRNPSSSASPTVFLTQ